jgi:ABC-2 type transport system ATP-binding protein
MSGDGVAIAAHGVSRSFGKKRAVEGVDLAIGPGRIYGLLGRNGAGKTTLLKMLAGLIRPDSGEVRVNGADPWRLTAIERQKVGYVSERSFLPPILWVGAILDFCAPLYPAWDHALVERLMARYHIRRRQWVRGLSLGTGRQLALILALAQRPSILLLDEPAGGLDVVARREFLDEMLTLLREENAAVLLSSHVLTDVERVADEIGIIADGRLIVSEPLDRLKETVKRVRLHAARAVDPTEAPPGALRTHRAGDDLLVTLRVTDQGSLQEWARGEGLHCEVHDLGLEDIFVDLAQES